jgi:hypothetical protein
MLETNRRINPDVCYTRYAVVSRIRASIFSPRALQIGNSAAFTLEVNPDGGTARDPDDYIDKRSTDKRPGCHGRELLQFARRKAADEAGRTAGGISEENSRAHH